MPYILVPKIRSLDDKNDVMSQNCIHLIQETLNNLLKIHHLNSKFIYDAE